MMKLLAFRRSLLIAALGVVIFAIWGLVRGPEATADGPTGTGVDFNRDIRPILSENCFACHGFDEKQRKAKLRLDTKDGLLGTLQSGLRAVVPGKSGESELIARITSTDPASLMPPTKSNKKLTPEQIAKLKQWIDQGAPYSSHWAFDPAKKPAVPKVKDAAWARGALDRFILARLEKEGLKPSPEADKATLIRRVTLDLTGLPPTPAEIDAFLADERPDAYGKLVDRLLQSPRYGEHMARSWLDAARYGDTHGLHLDNYREMWPYRDWVVRSFNRNQRFDQFVIEQLAGDLLPSPTLEQLVATGYNRCHVTTSEGGSIEEEVYVRNVVDQVDTNGTVLLGLSVGCARCHDHKYDPIPQKDYYALFAFFNSIDGRALDGNNARHAPIVRVSTLEQNAAAERVQRELTAMRKLIADEVATVKLDAAGEEELAAWLKAQRVAGAPKLPKPLQDAVKLDPAKHSAAQKKLVREHFIENVYSATRPVFPPLQKELLALQKQLDQLEKDVPTTLIFKELPKPRPAYVLKRGEYDQRGEQVERGTPAFLPPLAEKLPRNRLGFARWLVEPGHPLTARVAVNRFWQQVFGTGIVKTAEDFGAQGEPPSHPELLDWLAVQFVEDGWDVRLLMKRLVTSAAYRQSSRVTKDRLAKDPANRLLSRGPRFRLDAETLRDQALAVSGLLVEKVGGPGVKPPQPYGLWEAVGYLTSNTRNFVADTGPEKVHRRSLYTFWKRTAPPPQMNTFDAPSREACRVRRERTNTPLQALLLLNETQYVECARALAERTMKEGGTKTEERIAHLFRLATGRRPDAVELAELASVFRDHLAAFTREVESAGKLIAVGESKPDAALNPSELAAWTMVANLVLNLDEVINKG